MTKEPEKLRTFDSLAWLVTRRSPSGAKETKLTFLSGTPVAEASVTGIGKFSALLDTGYSGFLLMKESRAREAVKGLRTWQRILRVPSGSSVGRCYAWLADRPLELPFGGVVEVPVVEVSGSSLLEKVEGVAGAGVLLHFRLTFDLRGERLWGESSPDVFVMPADPDKPDAFGMPPIFSALGSGEVAAVDKLLAAGAAVATVDNTHPAGLALGGLGDVGLAIRLMEKDTAGTWKKSNVLNAAVHGGHTTLVDWLLSHGVDREASAGIINYAARNGDIETARRLRAAGYLFATKVLHAGTTAVSAKQADFLAWMLKEEPSITGDLIALQESSRERTRLLNIAAGKGEAACVKVLLDAGADPLLPDETSLKNTPLGNAAGVGHAAVIRTLLGVVKIKDVAALSFPGPLHMAILQPDCIRILLEAGMPADSGDEKRPTPLLLCALSAAQSKDRGERAALGSSAAALIRAGANVEVSAGGELNHNLVDIFSNAGLAEPLKLVLDKGLDSNGNAAAVAAAAEFGEVEVLRMLLAAGADVHRPNSNGGTALLLAVSNGHTSCVRELLLHNADARQIVPDDSGNTLMHQASRYNDPFLLKTLADAGTLIDTPNKADITPLQVAIESRTLLAVRFLLAHGASPNGSGFSAADMAEYLSPKYPALQSEVREAAAKRK